ncbi:Asp-tRNAAsn/Glu-tRNAGln amidotransferase A subunit [Granulicella pectinivorans]|uniref:Asp-tRNAAsn/Glu-tRNAGln amidotransferase A subunit n=1 Tax=Granulicella pectinivorans TaxID=474950 RepID=A0A1I6M1X4_9BACT|nr:amidase [Granulicella pectinivorans]SFS09717.1 Asp-tRNAAsn/Glu-tRNAGln amidotransferase A subunit [Granulicella pectinivorans]
MKKTRRQFAVEASLVAMGALGISGEAQVPAPQQPTPGAPPAFGTAPPVGPEVTVSTFAEAEKLMQSPLSAKDRAEAAGNWRQSMAAVYERRVGPRKLMPLDGEAPATVWDPSLGMHAGVGAAKFVRSAASGAALPKDDAAIAFSTVTQLSRWIETKQITSERLTRIYIARLKKYDPTLRCVITLCEEHALAQAKAADKEMAAGKYRGPLHGIPWGAKDLLDTAGIRTTWGAEFYRDRVPAVDGAVTKKLNDAGAVLVAKLSLGALALNDVWFGGQTMNPWLTEEGSSGSSAGPGSAVAAGLVGFAIGSETQGSIVSPSMRCGVTGFRPTYGQVPRTGAMALSWTCDKLGPMARGVEDTMLVLAAISGDDPGDTASAAKPVRFDAEASLAGLKVGYIPAWMKEAPATDVDRAALEAVTKLGMTAVPVSLPDWPYDSLNVILFAEAAAAFEAETLDGRLDQLRMQVPDAWPNTFRQARFLSAVDFVQADRMRRKVALEIARIFREVDVLLVPSLRDEQLVIFNFTGHPSLTLRAGFVEVGEARSDWAPDPARPLPKFTPKRRVPHGVTVVGRLFEDGLVGRVGMAMEKKFGVSGERPRGF